MISAKNRLASLFYRSLCFQHRMISSQARLILQNFFLKEKTMTPSEMEQA